MAQDAAETGSIFKTLDGHAVADAPWLAVSLRRELRGRDAELHEVLRQPSVADQGSTGSRQSGRGLDSVAALSRQPKKSIRAAVGTDHGQRVRGEGPEARPGARDAPHVQRGCALQALDACSHVEIIGMRIHRRAGTGIRRRDEQLSGVRLEIKFLRDIVDQGPSLDLHSGRRRYIEGGAPLGHEPERPPARSLRDRVGPRACGDEQRRCVKISALMSRRTSARTCVRRPAPRHSTTIRAPRAFAPRRNPWCNPSTSISID